MSFDETTAARGNAAQWSVAGRVSTVVLGILILFAVFCNVFTSCYLV